VRFQPFLSHYISRVYWSHWHKDHRLALLDAAEEALKPIPAQIDKPQIKRLIEREEAGRERPYGD
jgi:ribonuclease BN (tRNA processing enzyme)